jgi:resuscitation-promoting factor RpfA
VNGNPAHHSALAPRARGLALAASAAIVLMTLGLQLAAMDRAAWRSVLRPGPASLDQALAATAGSVALVLVVWLLIALLLSLLAALGSGTSALGLAVANLARLVAPMILRNAVAGVLGVAIAAAPAAADAVHPAPTAGQSRTTAQTAQRLSADQELSPAWIPARDQPPASTTAVATRGSTPPPGPTDRRSEIRADPELLPGWIPSRPPAASVAKTTAELAPVAPAARARVEPDDEVVVRRGETLWDIAARHLGTGATDGEIAVEWPHWFTANRAVIGPNPDHLVPGERLRAPEPAPVERAARGPAREGARGGAGR